jgi:hypothetical protein
MPGFYRGQKASKSPLDKVCTVPAYDLHGMENNLKHYTLL